MKHGFRIWRNYCSFAPRVLYNQPPKQKVDFSKLKHVSKVPMDFVRSDINGSKNVLVDIGIIQSLERLSLVNLDGQEALTTLRSSLQFAENIININTDNTEPLYTVLYNQSLSVRADEVYEGDCREHILQNAQRTDEDYFISPPGNIPLKQ